MATTNNNDEEEEEEEEVTFHLVGDAYVDFFSFLEGNWPESGGDSRLVQPVQCFAGGSCVNTATHLKSAIRNFCCDAGTNTAAAAAAAAASSNEEESKLPSSKSKPPGVILHTVLNPKDRYGQILLDHAKKHDIPIQICRQNNNNNNDDDDDSSASTGHCIVIVSGGERSFMTHQGVVENFGAQDIHVESIVATSTHVHLHLAGYYNIEGFWNGQLKRTLEQIRNQRMERYPNKKTTISLVTQHDATNTWDGGLSELFPLLDFVIVNTLEARNIIRSSCSRNNTNSSGLEKMKHEHSRWAEYFGGLCPTTSVIVTRGEMGSVALRGKRILCKQKPVVVDAIDPTGAGDSFAAGFLFGLWSWRLSLSSQQQQQQKKRIKKNDDDECEWPVAAIEEGGKWGVSLASAAVLIRGASFPSPKDDIQNFLDQAKTPEYP